MEIYEIPDTIHDLFQEVEESEGSMSYRIINYSDGMSMDNTQSMSHFIDCVNIASKYIDDYLGTQLTLKHPNYDKQIVIDSGGLGDFFSHGFDCYWHDESIA